MRKQAWLGAIPAVVAVVAVIVALTQGSGVQPPATGAAAVVPADALAYVHVSTDSKRSAVSHALAVGPRLSTYPLVAAKVISRLTALVGGGARVDFKGDIRPWLGREVALGLLNSTGSTAGSELVLDVSRPRAARAFIARAGAVAAGTYRGASLYRYPSGASLAFVEHYLVLGQGASVRSAIDASKGIVRSLARSQSYQSAAAGEPADRVLDAYLSSDGVHRLLTPQGGLFAALGALLGEPGLTGATISLSASGTTARFRIHSAFARAGAGQSIAPSLAQFLPAGTTLALDLSGIVRTAPRVLSAAASVGIATHLGPLLGRLGAALGAEGVALGRIESLFSGETMVAIAPGGGVVILAPVKNEQATRAQLANLEVPLAQLFAAPAAGSGQVPQFIDRSIDGISAHQLSLGTGLRISYAVFHGLLAISTSLAALGDIAHHSEALTSEPAYRAAVGSAPSRVTSLVFLDFNQLLDLAERTGLLRGARLEALRPDFERIRAVGLYSTRGEADSTAELTFEIK